MDLNKRTGSRKFMTPSDSQFEQSVLMFRFLLVANSFSAPLITANIKKTIMRISVTVHKLPFYSENEECWKCVYLHLKQTYNTENRLMCFSDFFKKCSYEKYIITVSYSVHSCMLWGIARVHSKPLHLKYLALVLQTLL